MCIDDTKLSIPNTKGKRWGSSKSRSCLARKLTLLTYNTEQQQLKRLRIKNALAGVKLEPLNINLADFDGVLYRISTPNNEKTKVAISISLKFYKELQSHGADELLRKIYGDLFMDETEEGFDVTVQIDLTNIPDDWEEKWVQELGRLKRNCFASVFLRYFDFQEGLENETVTEGADQRVSLVCVCF